MIDRFLEYYYFLSNFYPCYISYPSPNCKGGPWLKDWTVKYYKSVEHAYQAFKCEDEAEHEYVRNLDTAGKAKKAGKVVKMRKDWEEIKFDLMLDLLRVKFEDEELAKRLIDTAHETLVEGNYWHDCVWGECYCENCKNKNKLNMLGKLLMIVRTELMEQKNYI